MGDVTDVKIPLRGTRTAELEANYGTVLLYGRTRIGTLKKVVDAHEVQVQSDKCVP